MQNYERDNLAGIDTPCSFRALGSHHTRRQTPGATLEIKLAALGAAEINMAAPKSGRVISGVLSGRNSGDRSWCVGRKIVAANLAMFPISPEFSVRAPLSRRAKFEVWRRQTRDWSNRL